MKKPVEFVRALVGLKNGKPVIQFQRPSLNNFEERWANAATKKRITIYFETNCPLRVCADPVTGQAKFGRSCNKKCLASNLARLKSFEKRIAKKTKKLRLRKSIS